MTSDAVAPYVYLANMDYDGIFSDNGFLAMPQKSYNITFSPLGLGDDKIDVTKFQQALTIRYIIEVSHAQTIFPHTSPLPQRKPLISPQFMLKF